VRAHRALTALVAVLLAVLPNTAQAAESYPDPLPLTGQQIIHDPAVIHLKSGGYAAYSTGGIIGARLSKDLRHWDDAGNAFAEPPSWWYEYNSTGDPWAPDISRRDGRYWLYYAVSSWGTNHSAIGVATSPSGLPGTWTDHGAGRWRHPRHDIRSGHHPAATSGERAGPGRRLQGDLRVRRAVDDGQRGAQGDTTDRRAG